MATRIFVWILFIGMVAGCSALEPKGTSSAAENERFTHIKQSAKLANAAYQDMAKIEKINAELGYQLVKHEVIAGVDVQYFLSRHPVTQAQLISVRGTANLENVLVDVKVAMRTDERLGIRLHRGFSLAANAIYEAVKPQLNKQAPVTMVGHSLGGAVASILAINLDVDGYKIEGVTTFGQPKFTDKEGMQKYKHIPITRVVNEKDMVPLVPHFEATLSALPSLYWHMGEEIVLFPGAFYSSLSAKESMARGLTVLKASAAERNIDAHKMAVYLARIDEKMSAAKSIPYSKRMDFITVANIP